MRPIRISVLIPTVLIPTVLISTVFTTALEGQEPSAVVTQLEAKVTALDSGREIRTLEVLGAGAGIRVAKNGRAGMICSTDHWIELAGPADWRVTAQSCSGGKAVEPGTYRSLAPRGGRFRTVDGILVMERDTRDIPDEALLLSPRETRVREAQPEIRWRRIDDVFEYEIKITGLDPIRVRSAQAECRPESEWDDEEICVMAWPEARALSPGDTAWLDLGYRSRLGGALEEDDKAGEGRRVERLDAATAGALDRRLESLAGLGLPARARTLAEAGLYAEHGLLAAAAAVYRRALDSGDAAVRVTVGDLYFQMGLYALAAGQYQSVLAGENNDNVRAAANFGMGRLHDAFQNYAPAGEFFQKAQGLFEKAGLAQESAAAAEGLARAQARQGS